MLGLFSISWEAYYVYAAFAVLISVIILIVNRRRFLNLRITVPIITTVAMIVFCIATSGSAAMGSLGRTIHRFIFGSGWPDESKYISELTTPKLVDGGLNKLFRLEGVYGEN